MGVVARSLAIIFRFQLFLIVTISYCHSQCNFKCFLLFNYESQSFLGFFLSLTDIRYQVDNILFHPECMRCQICKEVNSFEDSSVSTLCYVTCHSRFFKSISKVQTVCFLTFKGLPICEKHFKVQFICHFGMRSSFKAQMTILLLDFPGCA